MPVPLAPWTDRLRYAVGRRLPFLRLAPPADRQVVFQYRPLRNAAIEWETTEAGEALLKVPRRGDRVGRVVGLFFRYPAARAVELDEVGSFVWGLCDGQHTVESIVQKTSRQYRMNRREVEISVTQYLQTLASRNFIAFYQKTGKSGGGKARAGRMSEAREGRGA